MNSWRKVLSWQIEESEAPVLPFNVRQDFIEMHKVVVESRSFYDKLLFAVDRVKSIINYTLSTLKMHKESLVEHVPALESNIMGMIDYLEILSGKLVNETYHEITLDDLVEFPGNVEMFLDETFLTPTDLM